MTEPSFFVHFETWRKISVTQLHNGVTDIFHLCKNKN